MEQSQLPKARTDLNEVALFTAVAAARSFSAAARQLGVPVSTVSRKVSQLETRLGVALLVRTTRQVRTTEVGAKYLAECERLLEGFAVAEADVTETATQPKGRLRVTAPSEFAANGPFVDLVERFLRRYPDVEMELLLENRRIDLVGEQVDVAIRAGTLNDSSLIAQRLGKTCLRLMASAGFLERHGPIQDPEQIAKLPCIRMSTRAEHSQWTLTGPQGQSTIRVQGPVAANSMAAISKLAAAGLGIAVLPDYRSDPLSAGLRMVLPDWSAGDAPMHVVYPARRLAPARLTAFVAFLIAEVEAGRLSPLAGSR